MPSSKDLHSNFFKKIIKKTLNSLGYEIKRINNFEDRYNYYIAETDEYEQKLITKFEKISLPSRVNLWSIIQSIKHIKNQSIEGDIVECGIYNGFTLSLIGILLEHYKLNKRIWGYDTFEEGFIKDTLTDKDIDIKNNPVTLENDNTRHYSLDEVIMNIKKNSDFNEKKYNLIKGNILNTLDDKQNIPRSISFLRMDTDIYATTKKQLEILYPRLNKGGVLHIDDYGICPGVKFAVDEYFNGKKIWLHRPDLPCRYMIKE